MPIIGVETSCRKENVQCVAVSLGVAERFFTSKLEAISGLLYKRVLLVTDSFAKETCYYIDTMAGAGVSFRRAIHSKSLVQKSPIRDGLFCKRDLLLYRYDCRSRSILPKCDT